MNFDMFSGKQDDNMDPNYIYPMPYIDPMMYANPYANCQMDQNTAMGGYVTYMNPYMMNPTMPQPEQLDEEYADLEMGMYMPQNQMQNMQYNIQCMPPQMMMQGMMPMMHPQMMMQGMMPMMPPQMMMQGMMPMMPGMMFPYMMPGMPQIHMDEFDEEEM